MLDGRGEFRRWAEEALGLGEREAGEPCRLQEGGGAIGGLDLDDEFARQGRGKPETQVNGREEARLDAFVGVADHCLERRDHVADHVFRRVVQEHSEAALTIEVGALVRKRFHQQRVLGDRKNVGADRLPVPARDAREPVRDVRDLDIERGGVEQVEPAPGKHALPGAEQLRACRRFRLRRHQRPASLASGACRWQVTM